MNNREIHYCCSYHSLRLNGTGIPHSLIPTILENKEKKIA